VNRSFGFFEGEGNVSGFYIVLLLVTICFVFGKAIDGIFNVGAQDFDFILLGVFFVTGCFSVVSLFFIFGEWWDREKVSPLISEYF
jgi:hypothetical protein